MTDDNTVEIDLSTVRGILTELSGIVLSLDGHRLPVDPTSGPARRANPRAAAVSRDLLRGADLCQLASAELQVLYWRYKGHPDPRSR